MEKRTRIEVQNDLKYVPKISQTATIPMQFIKLQQSS